jgi:hypothetical protein
LVVERASAIAVTAFGLAKPLSGPRRVHGSAFAIVLESEPDVPSGRWYKRFKSGTLAGRGEMPSTFLARGMAVEGEEVE